MRRIVLFEVETNIEDARNDDNYIIVSSIKNIYIKLELLMVGSPW